VLWDWRDGRARPKDLAARSFLLKLEQRGWIALPPLRVAFRSTATRKQRPIEQKESYRWVEGYHKTL